MDIEYVIIVIVAVCLLLAGYEMRDDIRHRAAGLLASIGIGHIEKCGDRLFYYVTLPSRRTLALFLILVMAAWALVARRA